MRSALRRKRHRSRRQPEPDLSLARRYWKAAVCRGGCVMCRAFPVPRELRDDRAADFRVIEGHHVLAQRHLQREGLASRLWDTRNGMALCRYHHGRHERWMQRVPYELVPDDALEFADELGLLHVIDRDYPSAGQRS
jgi:HNH endonuclease